MPSEVAAKPLPKGFICTKCATRHDFGVYAMAHWDTELTHTCAQCKAVHKCFRGRVHRAKTHKLAENFYAEVS